MNTTRIARLLALVFLVTGSVLHAQVPQLINYQGRVVVGTVNFDGSGQFKFALVNADGSTTYWSNDGTSSAGSEPAAAVALTVTKGLYSVLLGDATLPNMTIVPATVFTNADVRLRVWFNDSVNGSQLLTPDPRIAAVGYAMMAGTAATVPDGAITSAKIANGAVTSTQIAVGAVGATQLADGTITAAKMADGAITADKLAKPVRTGSVASSSLAVDPTGVSFTVPFSPAFGSVPNVTLTMDAPPGSAPSKAHLALTSRTAGQFTALVSNGTSSPLTEMTRVVADAGSGNTNGDQYASLGVVNGNPAIAYQHSINLDLKYVRATDANGTTWGAPLTLASSGDVGYYISLAVVNGNPAISYLDGSNQDLKYIRATDANGTTWGTPVTIQSTGNVGYYPSLTIVNGNPAISYTGSPNGLYYVRATDADGTAWGAPVSLSGIGSFTSLLVVNGNPAISYMDNTPNNTGMYVRATDVNGTNWGAPVTIGSGGLSGRMAIVNGNPAIVGSNRLYVRANDTNGATWGAPVTLVGTNGVFSLAVINGHPAIFGWDGVYGTYWRAADANGAVWSDYVRLELFTPINMSTTSMASVNGQPAYTGTVGTDLVFIRAGAPLPFNILWMALEP